MRIGLSTGWAELDNFWGRWPWSKQMGGSEWIATRVARALREAGHEVTVRLPYHLSDPSGVIDWGVRWVGANAAMRFYDVLFCFDDFERTDEAERTMLVACRSDPPRHTDFDRIVFLSATHARLMGHTGATHVGGGVALDDYAETEPLRARKPRRVIYTSSPDRGGHHAAIIGRDFDFVATYRGAREMTRAEIVALQRTARVLVHPYDPARESEFFCMSILEAMAAGTPCVISDGPALVELWGDAAIVLARPVRYARWVQVIEDLLADREAWRRWSALGIEKAKDYSWSAVAAQYLKEATD